MTITRLEDRQRLVEAELEALQARSAASEAALRTRVSELELVLSTLEGKCVRKKERLRSVRQREIDANANREAAENLARDVQSRARALQARVDSLMGIESESTRLAEELDKARAHEREALHALEERLAAEQAARTEERETWRLRVSSLEDRVRSQETLSEDKLRELLSRMQSLSLQKGEAEGRADEQARQLQQMDNEARELRRRLQEAERELTMCRSTIEAHAQQIVHLNATVKKQREALVEAEQALYGAQSPAVDSGSGSIMI
mmetsp:Transcript_33545/g.76685  ORF Transcript_33545/g.76685 Transcript_33545/m.76685 type:complete len:264 (+) Transcript_33545:73-864(+)